MSSIGMHDSFSSSAYSVCELDQSCALCFKRGEALVPHKPGADPDVEKHPILNNLALGDALEVQARAHA